MSTFSSSKKATRQKTNNVLFIQKSWIGKTVKWIWILFLVLLVTLPLYIIAVQKDLLNMFGGMPSMKAIENPDNDLSSEILSADGVSLGRYFRYNRSQVSFDQLSPHLVNTLLLSEDHRFYQHSGIDLLSYPRVIFGVLTGGTGGGGSTITQQLAKNLFRTRGDELDGTLTKLGGPIKILISKTKEWIIAIQLEKNYTKEEIITMYLNTFEFGSNAYGIKVASETFFKKQPADLDILESSLVVGMLQNPSLFDPKRRPENALRKRNDVLKKLLVHNYLKSAEELDSLRQIPIQLKYSVQNQNQGLATYFRTVLQNDLMRWCKENNYDLWEAGLKIYTTIDSRMQQFAEDAMESHMAKLQGDFNTEWQLKNQNPWVDDETQREIKGFLDSRVKRTIAYKSLVSKFGEKSDSVKILLNTKKPMTVFSWKGERDTLFSTMDSLNYYYRFLHAGLMSMDPETGAIRAWVGGIDHKFFKYDHVRQGTRQPGSTFKPFVYGKAIEDGYSPCHELRDVTPTIKVPGGVYRPRNAEGDYGTGAMFNLRQAMARSINSITAQLIDKVNPANVVDFAHRAGITSDLLPVPSLCLGTSDVSLYELVAAYCSFVNLGISIKPYYITRIEDKNGNVLQNFVPETKQAMDEKTAYKMVYMLQGGVEEEGGTSRGLSAFLKKDNEIGGKTGTTQNASDGWYMGITHNLVTGVWVGGDERSIHFPSWLFGQGGRTARPIWDKYMVNVYEHPETGYAKGVFKRPAKLDITLDCSKHVASDTTTTIQLEPEVNLDDIDNY